METTLMTDHDPQDPGSLLPAGKIDRLILSISRFS